MRSRSRTHIGVALTIASGVACAGAFALAASGDSTASGRSPVAVAALEAAAFASPVPAPTGTDATVVQSAEDFVADPGIVATAARLISRTPKLVAVERSNGDVCSVDATGAGCSFLTDSMPFTWSESGFGADWTGPVTMEGLVATNVASMSLTLSTGSRIPLPITGGTFYRELPPGSKVRNLAATMRDGRSIGRTVS